MAKKILKVKFKGGKINGNLIHARIPATIMGPKINFVHRHMATIDTGVEINCPDGYKLGMRLVPTLSNRGMVALNLSGGLKSGQISVVLFSMGREIIELKDGDPLIETWLESDQTFEFEAE